MPSLGILVLNYEQEQDYFKNIALTGEKFSFTIHLFQPTDINPITEDVTGLTFDHQQKEWVNATYSLPQFIYDRCFYKNRTDFKKNHPIVQWLKAKEETTFLGYGLPNKWHLYEALIKNKKLSPYLPLTRKGSSPEKILQLLKEEKQILCKPESGSQGKGIFVLKQNGNGILLSLPKKGEIVTRMFSTTKACYTWLKHVLSFASYLVQPYLPLHDEGKHPYDVRVFIQKDIRGKWVERGRAVRIGKQESILSNLHSGGTVFPYHQWLKKFPRQTRAFLQEEIDMIIKQVPLSLEEHFPPLFEIGLDIGVATDLSVWLLDTNSKPGRQVITHGMNIVNELYEAPFQYCNYLLAENKR